MTDTLLDRLDPAVVADLAAIYRLGQARRAIEPRAAEAVAELGAVAKAAAALGAALGNLRPRVLGLLMDRHAAAGWVERCDALAAQAHAERGDLIARGAEKGGNRRLSGLYGPPPRFTLLLILRREFARAGIHPSKRELAGAAAALLTLAGAAEPERGLEDLVRRLPQNRAISG